MNLIFKIIFISIIAILDICAAPQPFTQQELADWLNSGPPNSFILVDLRDLVSSDSVIGNAQCKPYNLSWNKEVFKPKCQSIPLDAYIVVYCQSGTRAGLAATWLDTSHYQHVYNAGGIGTWMGPKIAIAQVKNSNLLPDPSMLAASSVVARQLAKSVTASVDAAKFVLVRNQWIIMDGRGNYTIAGKRLIKE